MSHLLRSIVQGSGVPDPRLRSYHIYKCNVCGHEQDYNNVPNFDTVRLRKCSNCGVTDDSNDKEFLIKRQHTLEQKIKEAENLLATYKNELEQVVAKLEDMEELSKELINE